MNNAEKIDAICWFGKIMDKSYGQTAAILTARHAKMVYRAYRKAGGNSTVIYDNRLKQLAGIWEESNANGRN